MPEYKIDYSKLPKHFFDINRSVVRALWSRIDDYTRDAVAAGNNSIASWFNRKVMEDSYFLYQDENYWRNQPEFFAKDTIKQLYS